jgi:hypothetical protein
MQHRSERTGLFIGKSGPKDPNPEIPRPLHKEIQVQELLEQRPHPGVAKRPLIVKERERLSIPHLNKIYSTLRDEGGWRYVIDNYATGSMTTAPEVVGEAPITVSVPATAGNITLFTGEGVINSIVVTTTGAAALNFQDGAGNIIAIVPGGSAAGFDLSGPFGFGTSLVAQKSATTPVVTVNYTPTFATGNALDILYQDLIGGQVIPLGEYPSNTPVNVINSDIIIPTPITDPSVTLVGNLLIKLDTTGEANTFNYQISFSGAYLLPDIRDDEMYARGGAQRENHHGALD